VSVAPGLGRAAPVPALEQDKLEQQWTEAVDKYFVVQMTCVLGREAEVMEFAGEHIQWMLKYIPQGLFVLAGPYLNAQGQFDDGLCIMRSDREETLETILQEDPFYQRGIRTYQIRAWDYHVDTQGYRINFSPELAAAWGVSAEVSQRQP